jgi:hypothetical protein
MRIHGQMTPVNAANFAGAAPNERAEANRRASETRRKLAFSAPQNASADSLSDDETFLVGHWLGTQSHDSLPGDEYHSSKNSLEDDLA